MKNEMHSKFGFAFIPTRFQAPTRKERFLASGICVLLLLLLLFAVAVAVVFWFSLFSSVLFSVFCVSSSSFYSVVQQTAIWPVS